MRKFLWFVLIVVTICVTKDAKAFDSRDFFPSIPPIDRDLSKPAAIIPATSTPQESMATVGRPTRQTSEERFFTNTYWKESDGGCTEITVWIDASIQSYGQYLSFQRNTYDYCIGENVLTDYGYVAPYGTGSAAIKIDERLTQAHIKGNIPATSCDNSGVCQSKQFQVLMVLSNTGGRTGSWDSSSRSRETDGSRMFSSNHTNYRDSVVEIGVVTDGVNNFLPDADPIRSRIGWERYESRQR